MNNQIHTENGAMSDVSGNPVSDDWCSTGTLAVVLGVKASTLSVWLANNRQWLAPYRRVLSKNRYVYYSKAVLALYSINKRGTGRREAWKALRPSPPGKRSRRN
jgi:hypothetical protein